MFYTVTLPATLWFFDKSKQGAEPTVLFIDARNIFRQVTRALREFTEEHIQNIAAIVRLHRGETERFTALLESYKTKAKEYELEAAEAWPAVETAEEKCAAAEKQWNELRAAVEKNKSLQAELSKITRQLNGHCKEKDEAKKAYKALTDQQHYFESHIQWLQERFPNGKYEDVTGLCKAATLKEIEEQDWSLNPGRYVGVVIEEDGLTEEEFLKEMKERHEALNSLNAKAVELGDRISQNLILLQ
jgi:type I restriction enzyme M protein